LAGTGINILCRKILSRLCDGCNVNLNPGYVELVALVGIVVAPYLEDLRFQEVPNLNLPSATYYFSVWLVLNRFFLQPNSLHHLVNFHFSMGEK
jgi:hypothetical protein